MEHQVGGNGDETNAVEFHLLITEVGGRGRREARNRNHETIRNT